MKTVRKIVTHIPLLLSFPAVRTFFARFEKPKYIPGCPNTSIMAAAEIKRPLAVDFQHIASV
ncbi:hypothetical protein MM716_29560, partial [Klebsiella pneumoniae]|nr:hypothetical protein [Klebsiella pneumoniae]